MATIVGLDLGSYAVKAVRLETRGRNDFEVLAYDSELLPPVLTSEDDDDAARSISERQLDALLALKSRGSLDGDLFITGLPGDIASLRTLSFPFADVRKIGETLPFELESEIPFDIEDVVYSWTVLGPRADGKETDVLVAFARREAMEAHLQLLSSVGIDPRHVEFDALALDDLYDGVFRASHQNEGPTEGPQLTPGGTVIESGPDAPADAVAMIDIGHRKTNVCLLAGERVVGAHTILHGGADATRALARALSLTLEEAEVGKRTEAFVEVVGASAQFPDQRQISDILKGALSPIVRRLRQIFQGALSTHRVRVTRVVLTGGGSRVLNVDRHLAEVLNVRVDRGRDVATRLGAALPLPADHAAARSQGEVPEAAGALAYALSGVAGDKTRARIDFRTGVFAFKGELDFVKERVVAFSAWALVLFVLLGASSAAKAWMYSSEEEELLAKQQLACKSITGMEIDSITKCLAIIQERITGQAGFAIPADSAADIYLEVAARIPPKSALARKVTELDVSDERVRMKATTSDFDAVDKIVAGLADGRCFSNVEKGKARNLSAGVEFDVTIRLDCEAAPGKPLPKGAATTTKVQTAPAKAGPPGPGKRPAIPSLGKMPPVPGAAAAGKGALSREERLQRAADRRKEREERRLQRSERMKDKRLGGAVDVNAPDAAQARREKMRKIRDSAGAIDKLKRAGEINPRRSRRPLPPTMGGPVDERIAPIKRPGGGEQ